MPDNKAKRGKADRSKIASGEKYEVDYAAKKAKTTPAAVKAAIKNVGPSRAKVEKALAQSKTKAPANVAAKPTAPAKAAVKAPAPAKAKTKAKTKKKR